MTDNSGIRRLLRVVGACCIVLLGTTAVRAQTVGYTGSFYGSRTTYPTERVDSVYVFNGVDVVHGPLRLTATVPWMRVATTSVADAAVPGTTLAATPGTGFGDPLFRLDARVVNDSVRRLQVGVATAVKVPLVDGSSLRGTGKADYAVGATAFKAVRRTSMMADVLFWHYGDPDGFDFSDTWSYSVGVAQVLKQGRWSALASMSGFTAGVNGMPPPLAVNLGVLALASRRQSVAVTASIGLNDSSSDFSLGTSWRIAR